MTLVLGLLTGAQAYDHDLSVTHAAREGTRYAATLAKEPTGLPPTSWGNAVTARIIRASAGDIDLSKSGHFVCVALLKADGTLFTDTAGNPYSQWLPSKPPSEVDSCYTSGLSGSSYSRVHVVVRRPDSIDTVFYSYGMTLESRSAARYEPVT